jgi:3-oxoacyl-[acyl-carrier-protein] synthase-3
VNAFLHSIATYLPEGVETNADLEARFPEWSASKISAKTGIVQRHVAAHDEFTSDLASGAARKLLEKSQIDPADIDTLIVVTQTPDFILPTTACLVHETLGLKRNAGAFDINLGCSGYVVGLATAKAFVEAGHSKNVMLVTADTYSKLLNEDDKSVRTIFGDGASASLITESTKGPRIGRLIQGTDGSGAGNLIVPRGSIRPGESVSPNASPEQRNLTPSEFDLFMDGPSIFNFTLDVVEPTLNEVLASEGWAVSDVDYFVFHQANEFMLNHLVKKMGLPPEKCPILMRDTGNTVSSTIPMALAKMIDANQIRQGSRLVLIGFGVGLSWAGISVVF